MTTGRRRPSGFGQRPARPRVGYRPVHLVQNTTGLLRSSTKSGCSSPPTSMSLGHLGTLGQDRRRSGVARHGARSSSATARAYLRGPRYHQADSGPRRRHPGRPRRTRLAWRRDWIGKVRTKWSRRRGTTTAPRGQLSCTSIATGETRCRWPRTSCVLEAIACTGRRPHGVLLRRGWSRAPRRNGAHLQRLAAGVGGIEAFHGRRRWSRNR